MPPGGPAKTLVLEVIMTSAYMRTVEEIESSKTPKRKGNGSGDGGDDLEPKKYTLKYDRPFQVKILGLMVQDPDFLAYVAPHIKHEHFTDKILATTYTTIQGIYTKHKCAITHPALTNELKKLKDSGYIPKEDAKHYAKTLGQMMKPIPDAAYVASEVEDFIKHMGMEVGILQAVKLHKGKKYDDIPDAIHVAHQEAVFTSSKDYSPLDNKYLKERLKLRKDMADRPELFRGISTGISSLDAKMYWNGIGKKELGVVMAPPNGGKSPFLLHVATAAMLTGHSVVFYTLELDEYFFDLRLDANLSNYSLNDLTEVEPGDVEKKILNRLKGCKGQLRVHDLSSLTPAQVERDLVSYKRKGVFPDLIVIDYADIMTPDTKAKERRHDFSAIYQGLRAIAKKENVAIWTASQANRESFKRKTMTMDSIAEDWGKAMIADYIIGLSQNSKDRNLKPERVRLSLVKNRNGEKGIEIKTRVDFSRMRFDVTVSVEEAKKEKELYGSKKEKVIGMIKDGEKTPKEIMDETGCSKTHFYEIKKEMEGEETE